jgi:hypothetical protein
MPLTEENAFDNYWGNDLPRCPFCDLLNELYKEGEHTFDCPDCEKEVTVHVSVSYKFSTDKQ